MTVIIRMSMVFIVNDQMSVILTGLPGIYVNVWHVTSIKDHTVETQGLTDLCGSPGARHHM